MILVVNPDGVAHVSELHSSKQYAGTKAHFETNSGTHELICFVHHVSKFVQLGANMG